MEGNDIGDCRLLWLDFAAQCSKNADTFLNTIGNRVVKKEGEDGV